MNEILTTDAITGMGQIGERVANVIVTSPPYYGLRSYGTPPWAWPAVTYSIMGFPITIEAMCCELGQEPDPKSFIGHLVLVFRQAYKTLRDDGTMWVNIADTYAGSWGAMSHQHLGKERGMDSHQRPPQSFVKSRRKEDAPRFGGGNVPATDGLKPGDLIGIPHMLAFAMRDDGWTWRQDVIWNKPNTTPESVNSRCTKSHEFVFMFSKPGKKRIWRSRDTNQWVTERPDLSERLADDVCPQWKNRKKWEGHRYYFDAEAIKTPAKESSIARIAFQDTERQNGSPVPGKSNGNMRAKFHGNTPRPGVDVKGGNQARERGHARPHVGFNERWDQMTRQQQQSFKANKRSVWTVSPAQYAEEHFAVFPEELIWDMVLAGCPVGGVVVDPFFGRGTTGVVARKQDKNYIGVELLPKNVDLAHKYIADELAGWQRPMFLEPIQK